MPPSAEYQALSRRATLREWSDEIHLRDYVRRGLFAAVAVVGILLFGGAVFAVLEQEPDFAEGCYLALSIVSTAGLGGRSAPKTVGGRAFAVLYSLLTFASVPILLNVAANGLSRIALTLIGLCAGFEITRDSTLRHRRRLAVVLVLLILHILLHALYVSTTLDISYLESTYISYMALSSIGIDWRLRSSHAKMVVIASFVLVGFGLMTLIAEDALELYQIYKIEQEYEDESEDATSPRCFQPHPESAPLPQPRPDLLERPRRLRKESSELGVLASIISPVHAALNGSDPAWRRSRRHRFSWVTS